MNKERIYKIIRKPEVLNITGWSKNTLYNRIHEGLFPTQIHLGARARGWVLHEVQLILAAMIAGQTHEEIRSLVTKIVSERANICGGGLV